MNCNDLPVANRLYQSDPIKLENYVEKFVEIVTVEGKKINGIVYTIDPVTESVVLFNKSNGVASMIFVMGHGVKNISITSGGEAYTECDKLYYYSTSRISKQERESRKEKLKSWLLKNGVPVEEKGEILIIKCEVQIYPPYGIEHCFSENENILEKVQNLISKMPVTM